MDMILYIYSGVPNINQPFYTYIENYPNFEKSLTGLFFARWLGRVAGVLHEGHPPWVEVDCGRRRRMKPQKSSEGVLSTRELAVWSFLATRRWPDWCV
ncbi:LOW QUALITY PROTEIN: hypothetical protein PanWU01x14_024730 [Parasponia andersonii]|uniref:Uncharacterized protein n=1 Tax=Parasponia andersonii TaxID=3476 RepID=A0A2P5DWP0_PARAD|nr:LOW QUALITY PROTEIN: hypothetical protein PanWU01x14_024730 [Parasponia andersonii]